MNKQVIAGAINEVVLLVAGISAVAGNINLSLLGIIIYLLLKESNDYTSDN
jgi:hypothetical protein